MWYFAYGSNMSTAQMVARTGGLPPSRRARLPGYRLAFNAGVGRGPAFANIVQPGDDVLGVLYSCSQHDIEALDGFESGYDHLQVEVLDETGTRFEAVAYIARPENATTERPSAEYLQRIVRGAREHGLPEEYIRSIEAAASTSG